METKTEKAKELFIYGDRVGAIRIFSSFRLGFTKEEKRTLKIAHECQTGHADFYQSIGVDTNEIWTKAKQIIKNKYGI